MIFKTSAVSLLVAAGVLALQVSACGGNDPAEGLGGEGNSGSAGDASGSGGRSGSDDVGAGGTGSYDGEIPATGPMSTWLGTNVAADLTRVNVAHNLEPFDTPDDQKDADGYPVAGASGTSSTDRGFLLPAGTYTLTYRGSGSLEVSGIGSSAGDCETIDDVHRCPIAITSSPGEFGRFLDLTITNGASETVTDVQLLLPGYSYDDAPVFVSELVDLFGPFQSLRFMDWMETNGSTLANWEDRPKATVFGAGDHGHAYEHMVELVNQTGKDLWVCVPEHADDAFVTSFANFLRDNLDLPKIEAIRSGLGLSAPFELIIEESNETWNSGFEVVATFNAIAQANTSRYTGSYSGSYGPSWASSTELNQRAQVQADRLATHVQLFRASFDEIDRSDVVASALAGWAIAPVYSAAGLEFIAEHYGTPKDYVDYVAIAPYFNTDDANSGSLDALFAGLSADIDAKGEVFAEFADLAEEYGVEMAAYEGGQHLTGETNQQLKHLAQHDLRMYEAYGDYFALWQEHFGESRFMVFSSTGISGVPEFVYQWGYWSFVVDVFEDTSACVAGLTELTGTESVDSVDDRCPKYRAILEEIP